MVVITVGFAKFLLPEEGCWRGEVWEFVEVVEVRLLLVEEGDFGFTEMTVGEEEVSSFWREQKAKRRVRVSKLY